MPLTFLHLVGQLVHSTVSRDFSMRGIPNLQLTAAAGGIQLPDAHSMSEQQERPCLRSLRLRPHARLLPNAWGPLRAPLSLPATGPLHMLSPPAA